MNVHARRNQMHHAIANMIEVCADILEEAQRNNPEGLTATKVATEAGLPDISISHDLSRAILRHMAQLKIAVDTQPGSGPGAWELTK